MRLILIHLFILSFSLSRAQINTKNQLASKLDGYWLGVNYLTKIEKTKSVFLNMQYETEIWGFILDSTNLISDSAYLNGFQVHEGGYGSFLYYDSKDEKFKADSKRNEEFSAFYGKDFNLEIEGDSLKMRFEEGSKVDIFKKVVDEQNFLRGLLFNKTYTAPKSNLIYFEPNGKVVGFSTGSYFEVVYDFTEGIEFDAILIYENEQKKERPTVLKYEFKENKLYLFKVKTNWETLERTVSKKPIILTTVEN